VSRTKSYHSIHVANSLLTLTPAPRFFYLILNYFDLSESENGEPLTGNRDSARISRNWNKVPLFVFEAVRQISESCSS